VPSHRTLCALRHVAFEDLGAFEPVLRAAGYSIRYHDLAGTTPEALRELSPDLLVVLGGPIGAYEEAAYPFLREELALLAQRIDAQRPVLGICLGAQLITRAAGARVYPGSGKEIGFAPLRLSAAGRAGVLAAYAEEPLAFHWHGDTFELPPGAERLASTARYENQAFRLGAAIFGFQFHPEAELERIEPWLIGHAAELAAAGIDVARLRRDAQAQAEAQRRKAASVARALLKAWGDDGD
jgi:GMP synthase (glutamine-hydrolysing)